MKFKILKLSVTELLDWQINIKAVDGLSDAKSGYTLCIKIDENYFAEKVAECEHRIKKIQEQPDMFEDWKTTVKSLKENIESIKQTQEEMTALEIDDFNVQTLQADFAKGSLLLQIPEEKIADIIKIRHSVEMFMINIK